MFRAIVPYLAYVYISLVGLTTRLKIVGDDVPNEMSASNKRFIYAFWHQRQVFFTWTHRHKGASVLVSRSADGELISKTMRLSGIGAVRGSSSRGGSSAIREMIETVQTGQNIGISPDGPKGPPRQVKDGVIYVAQKLGIPIIPITNALSHVFVVDRSWDRFHIPLPFGKGVVIYGRPIYVSANDVVSEKANELRIALDEITASADDMVR